MDHEVRRFLAALRPGAKIVDVGGCWGWHWRHLAHERPDVRVIIVDFVRSNLKHAAALLGDNVNKSVFLVHGDATDLRFPDGCFDAYWSVQTLQHIVKLENAVAEASRVLRPGGRFASYSLNDGAAIRWLSRLANRRYVTEGWVDGSYWLARASDMDPVGWR